MLAGGEITRENHHSKLVLNPLLDQALEGTRTIKRIKSLIRKRIKGSVTHRHLNAVFILKAFDKPAELNADNITQIFLG